MNHGNAANLRLLCTMRLVSISTTTGIQASIRSMRWNRNDVANSNVGTLLKRNRLLERVTRSTTNLSYPRDNVGYVTPRPASGSPDLSEWEERPRTQIISEKAAATSPYLA